MSIKEVAKRIKNLEIQSATNITLASIKAIRLMVSESKARTAKEFFSELYRARKILFSARPTEPMLRNYVNFIIKNLEHTSTKDVDALKKTAGEFCSRIIKDREKNRKLIAMFGSKIIPDHGIILTHCHSSTIIDILREAKAMGKRFEVFCTETRPLFQGRLTAQETLRVGIKTTMIIDGAVGMVMQHVNSVIVGADVITRSGDIINKIGTAMIAQLAHDNNIPFYVAADSIKLDPEAVYGEDVKIEERGGLEIWQRKPPGLMIRNPAFDVTKGYLIKGIITEFGVVPPSKFSKFIEKNIYLNR
jgi:ribose 1,5-bisphosphate isomerase